MKNLFIVSKTHLDLGFTDYAHKIKEKYITQFIPKAIELAEKLNNDGTKKYVWTTGSWLIKECLECGREDIKNMTEKALKDGNIAPHGLAFTTHSELMDKDLLEYNLSIAKKLDKISGYTTIAAKMTDVPGHTKAIVPLLAQNGIKLLHIGINTASAYPQVPECFLWKCDGYEVVVIYADGYGGEFKCPYIDEILYFDNAADNHGTDSSNNILKTIDRLQKKYPDYKVAAGRLDDIAESLWAVRDKLPVVTEEIGDTWIHGVATDPYKVACFRTLLQLKNEWLKSGKLDKSSKEYELFADNLLCICEHTWGQDSKVHFCDTENYTKDRFIKARAKDIVRPKNIFGDFPFRFMAFITNIFGDKHYRYSQIEKSWQEQRQYIENAVNCLPPDLKTQALQKLSALRPDNIAKITTDNSYNYGDKINAFDYTLQINNNGGVTLYYKDDLLTCAKDNPLITYHTYGAKDYKYYSDNYIRHHLQWAVSDNLMPGLKGKDKYPQGIYFYKIIKSQIEKTADKTTITAIFECEKLLCEKAGTPRNISCEYTLSNNGLDIKLIWNNKDAVRFTESTGVHFYPQFNNVNYVKIGTKIDPNSVISYGGRKLSVVEKTQFEGENINFEIMSCECPLLSSSGNDIMKFDNNVANIKDYGITYILHDNLWSTNFPLWYEENAMFTFNISKK